MRIHEIISEATGLSARLASKLGLVEEKEGAFVPKEVEESAEKVEGVPPEGDVVSPILVLGKKVGLFSVRSREDGSLLAVLDADGKAVSLGSEGEEILDAEGDSLSDEEKREIEDEIEAGANIEEEVEFSGTLREFFSLEGVEVFGKGAKAISESPVAEKIRASVTDGFALEVGNE